MSLGGPEIFAILFVVILLFGAKKIPELAKSVVDAIKHLRDAFKDIDDTKSDTVAKKK